MAVRDRHSSRVWPGCSLSGCGPKPVRFFCRSSEMLLASLAAITRNGCARSAFQPRLAGVFAFWVRTETCPLFLPVVCNAPRVSRGDDQKWLCALGIPAASGRGIRFLGADQNLSAFSAGRLKCCSRLSWLSQEMAVRDRHSSRVWPGCSLSGCGPKPVRFFCRSSEMLLASLAAITRDGCARSAFQPRLAGGFAFWVRTKTCPLFLPLVCDAARVSRGYHKKWLCAIGIPAASGRGVRFLGADQNLSAFSAGRLKCCSRLSRLSQEMAVHGRSSSRVWPGCSLSGCGPKPVRFFCRSSEMLLASLVAITRNGCARSAFQPRLAGVFAFWVRTKTCPLFLPVV